MVKAVIANSAAGNDHPDDPNLKIPLVSQVSKSGLPDPAMEGSHAYGYSNGLFVTDTWTVNGNVYIKTYTYAVDLLTGESDWVKQ